MATEALKSTQITNLDSVPPLKAAGGAGAAGLLQEVSANITNTAGVLLGSTYQMCRVRSDCYVKHVYFECAAQGGSSAVDIGVWYSDQTLDFPTNPSLPGTAIVDNFFADNLSTVSATAITDVTNNSGQYTADKRTQPLWQAVGLATDPGGMFDIVILSEATLTNGILMGLSVQFVTV